MIFGQGSQEVTDENPPLSRQNPLLREYFRKRHQEGFTQPTFAGQSREQTSPRNKPTPEDPSLDRLIDRQIDLFLEEIREKLGALETSFSELQRLRSQLWESQEILPLPQTKRSWKPAVKTVEKKANDLYKTIGLVLTNLKKRGDLRPEIEPEAATKLFEAETLFIGNHIEKAKQGIEGYFFNPIHTVRLSELRGENMLGFLHQVREMCKELEKQL